MENFKKLCSFHFVLVVTLLWANLGVVQAQHVKIGLFNVDATPAIGTPVAYAIVRHIDDSLSARGVVILSKQKPIVLCAVDWIGISNEGQDVRRKKLADAASTTIDRVSVHTLHQHDGAICDFTTERIMKAYGMGGKRIDNDFANKIINRVAAAVQQAVKNAVAVTSIGFGQAKVDSVASNRRVTDKDGIIIPRWSSVTDAFLQAAPEGLIDPWLKCVSFWNKDKPVAILTYYATHPQSYYGQGDVTCEFVGIARNDLEKNLGIPIIHFNGASGNITAGKYNDGSIPRRMVLARRIEDGMRKAWLNTKRYPISDKNIAWNHTNISLPLGNNIVKSDLLKRLNNDSLNVDLKYLAAEKLAWYERCKSGHQVTISSLKLGNIWLLNIPGEAFVQFQLAAQKMRPDEYICTAAYEEFGPGYIGTKDAYSQKGGYETSDIASGTAPEADSVLIRGMRTVLK
jgi:hypothetical protein